MKTTKVVFIAIALLFIAACDVTKKSAKPTASSVTAPTSITSSTRTIPPPLPKSLDGIYDPGNEELKAIQAQYKEVTLAKLKEGYMIYTQGACTNCHNPKGIYQFKETEWKGIVDDMAQKALISDDKKDAVYKYVLSIKATEPK